MLILHPIFVQISFLTQHSCPIPSKWLFTTTRGRSVGELLPFAPGVYNSASKFMTHLSLSSCSLILYSSLQYWPTSLVSDCLWVLLLWVLKGSHTVVTHVHGMSLVTYYTGTAPSQHLSTEGWQFTMKWFVPTHCWGFEWSGTPLELSLTTFILDVSFGTRSILHHKKTGIAGCNYFRIVTVLTNLCIKLYEIQRFSCVGLERIVLSGEGYKKILPM